MKNYPYQLEKGSKKHICPNCGQKTFVRYVDSDNKGQYLPDEFGRCDREVKCGYWETPYNNLYRPADGTFTPGQFQYREPIRPPETVFIPDEVLAQTRRGFEQNTFLQNLIHRVPFTFPESEVVEVAELYKVGTVLNGYMATAITFPYIDEMNRVRAIQVRKFDEANHGTDTNFIHSLIQKHHERKGQPLPGWLAAYMKQDLKVSCFFGAHLLPKFSTNPVAIVEAGKTAMYGTLYFGHPTNPKNLLWLASFNLSALTLDKCKPLAGRTVLLFPDLSKDGATFKKWREKAEDFSRRMPGTKFVVSDWLEKTADEHLKQKGGDIADWLIQKNWRLFRSQAAPLPQPAPRPTPPPGLIGGDLIESLEQVTGGGWAVTPADGPQPDPEPDPFADAEHPARWFRLRPTLTPPPAKGWEDWEEVREWYRTATIPAGSYTAAGIAGSITDLPSMVDSHLAFCDAHPGGKGYTPYFGRLRLIRENLMWDEAVSVDGVENVGTKKTFFFAISPQAPA